MGRPCVENQSQMTRHAKRERLLQLLFGPLEGVSLAGRDPVHLPPKPTTSYVTTYRLYIDCVYRGEWRKKAYSSVIQQGLYRPVGLPRSNRQLLPTSVVDHHQFPQLSVSDVHRKIWRWKNKGQRIVIYCKRTTRLVKRSIDFQKTFESIPLRVLTSNQSPCRFIVHSCQPQQLDTTTWAPTSRVICFFQPPATRFYSGPSSLVYTLFIAIKIINDQFDHQEICG